MQNEKERQTTKQEQKRKNVREQSCHTKILQKKTHVYHNCFKLRSRSKIISALKSLVFND